MKNHWETLLHPIQTLPSGDILKVQEYIIKGEEAGPKVYIQAGIHGAELQGNLVIHQLFEHLKNQPIRGEISLIPMANPLGINSKMGEYTLGRFNSVTGDNYNRLYFDYFKNESNQERLKELCQKIIKRPDEEKSQSFKMFLDHLLQEEIDSSTAYGTSETKKLFYFLQKKSCMADIVLDLHTGPMACRYLYSPSYLKEEAKHLLIPHTLIIPEVFAGALDEASCAPWAQLKNQLKELGSDFRIPISSYTVELGSEERINEEEAIEDLERILNYLAYKKVYLGPIKPKTTLNQFYCPLEQYKSYFAPTGGLVVYHKAPGQSFAEGEKLATLYNFRLRETVQHVNALKGGIVINHGASQNVREGMTLFQVMESPQVYD